MESAMWGKLLAMGVRAEQKRNHELASLRLRVSAVATAVVLA